MEYNHETAEFYSKKDPGFLEISIKKQNEKKITEKRFIAGIEGKRRGMKKKVIHKNRIKESFILMIL